MLTLLALLACSLPSAPWPGASAPIQDQRLDSELAARDVARVHMAREARFAELWDRAAAPQREAARARLRVLRDRRARSLTSSTDRAVALAEAWRALRGGPAPDEEGGQLATVIDALDLRVVPGGFAAREEGLGEAITVHVRPLFEVELGQEVELSLYWRSLADGVEERARTEPIVPEALNRGGFEMYLRPPRSAPGRYELVPELRSGDLRLRGFPTVVDCAADLSKRATALDQLAHAGDELAVSLRDGIAPRVLHGLRTLDALPLEDALRLGLGDGLPLGPLRVVAGPDGTPLWSRAGVFEPRARVILIASAAPEHPSDVLSGASGAAWEALARSLDAQLLATDRPALANDGPDLIGLLESLRAERELEQLAVVARGDTGVLLIPRLRKEENVALVNRLLLQSSLATRRPPMLGLSIPVLSIEALAGSDQVTTGGEAPGRWCWLRRQDPQAVLDARAPGLYLEWLEGAFDGGH